MTELEAKVRELLGRNQWVELWNLYETVLESGDVSAKGALVEAYEILASQDLADADSGKGDPIELYRSVIDTSDRILALLPGDVAVIAQQAYSRAALAELEENAEDSKAMFDEALRQYDEAIAMGPRDGSILDSKAGTLISMAMKDGSPEAIIKYVSQAIELYKKALQVEEPYYHFYTWRETLEYLEQNEDERVKDLASQARSGYDEAFKLVADKAQVVSSWAGNLVRMASYRVDENRTDAAKPIFEEALEKLLHLETLPNSTPRVHCKAGQNFEAVALYVEHEEADLIRKAIRQYRRAIQLDPEDSYAYIYAAQAYQKLATMADPDECYDNAVKTYQEAIGEGAGSFEILLDYGKLLFKMSQEAEGGHKREKLLKRAADKYARSLIHWLEYTTEPYYVSARIWAELGDTERALKFFRYGLMCFWRFADYNRFRQAPRFASLRANPEFEKLLSEFESREPTDYSESEIECSQAQTHAREAAQQLYDGVNAMCKYRNALDTFEKYAENFFHYAAYGSALFEFAVFTQGDERHDLLVKAAAQYERALEEEPDLFAKPYVELVRINRMLNNHDKANEWWFKTKEKFTDFIKLDYLKRRCDI